jgi:DNA helicase-2/ATP-dependent DNA helicase PcrA
LQNAAVSANVSLWDVISSPLEYGVTINKGTAAKLRDFRLLIEDFQDQNKKMPVAEIAEYIIKRSGIAAVLFQDTSVEGISRQENVQELLNAMNEFVSIWQEEGAEDASLTDFLMEVSLMTDQDNEKDENTDLVTLMTVHSAKGLEFKNVFIVGMENDLFPSQRVTDNPRAVEEERRLFYVAITRAKENCMITYSKNRYRNGQSNTATPSFFIKDIDGKYLDFPDDIELPFQGRESYLSFSRNHNERQGNMYGRRAMSGHNPAWDAESSYYGASGKNGSYNRKSPTGVHQQSVAPLNTSGYTRMKNTGAATTAPVEKVNMPEGLTVGNRVLHERFGEGEVIALEGTGSNAKATVKFRNAGEKKLLLKFAKLVVSG